MNIAIVSINKDKYSETFIHNHLKHFQGNVHFLYGGYFPLHYSTDRGKNSALLSEYGINPFTRLFSAKPGKESLLKEGVKNYLLKNKIDVIFCEYGPSGVKMRTLAEELNIPLIVHFHGYDAYRKDVLGTYGKEYPELFKTAAAIIAVSSGMRHQLQTLKCPAEKIHLIHYGADTDIFCSNSNPAKALNFVSCGRFVKKKAPQLVIKAFHLFSQKFPEARLVMIGDGELLEECRLLVKELRMQEKIEFTGSLTQHRIAAIYAQSFAFLQHSIITEENDSEGTPLAVIESGLCGLPPVSTWHGGIPDVVTDGETGFLVKEGDWQGMAEKMSWLATHPQQATEMGMRAAQKLQRYSLYSYTGKLMQLIENSKRNSQ